MVTAKTQKKHNKILPKPDKGRQTIVVEKESNKPLNSKQLKVCNLILAREANGMTNAECYQKIYRCRQSTARVQVSKLLKKANFSSYLEKQLKKITEKVIEDTAYGREKLRMKVIEATSAAFEEGRYGDAIRGFGEAWKMTPVEEEKEGQVICIFE